MNGTRKVLSRGATRSVTTYDSIDIVGWKISNETLRKFLLLHYQNYSAHLKFRTEVWRRLCSVTNAVVRSKDQQRLHRFGLDRHEASSVEYYSRRNFCGYGISQCCEVDETL